MLLTSKVLLFYLKYFLPKHVSDIHTSAFSVTLSSSRIDSTGSCVLVYRYTEGITIVLLSLGAFV